IHFDETPIDPSYLRPSTMVVKAFDGARSEVIGDIDVPLKIGPSTFNVLFQLMDFSVECGQAIVYREEDVFVTKTSALPCMLSSRGSSG
ncbi:hypothetical protein Csa_008010, partial [Cucumis sativus]